MTIDPTVPVAPQPAPSSAPTLAQLKAQQKFAPAVAAGLAAAVVGAVLWAAVTVVTKMEIGYVAIAIGYVVGQAIKKTGHGLDRKFGYLGAACSLFGCVLGSVFCDIAFFAQGEDLSLGDAAAALNIDRLTRLVVGFFQPMDLLFYAIATYEGYKLSFKYRVVKPKPPAQAVG